MKERPILFSAPMVRALLDGSKTQTRRMAKDVRHPDLGTTYSPGALALEGEPQHVIERACPYGRPGDRLWVRETWAGPLVDGERWEASSNRSEFNTPEFCRYAADGGPRPEFIDADDNFRQRWTPAIHMFRRASRITLEVAAVRVERLQDICEADAKAEGGDCLTWNGMPGPADPIDWPLKTIDRPWANGYAVLWEAINGAGSWAANPWVWAVDFRRIHP